MELVQWPFTHIINWIFRENCATTKNSLILFIFTRKILNDEWNRSLRFKSHWKCKLFSKISSQRMIFAFIFSINKVLFFNKELLWKTIDKEKKVSTKCVFRLRIISFVENGCHRRLTYTALTFLKDALVAIIRCKVKYFSMQKSSKNEEYEYKSR